MNDIRITKEFTFEMGHALSDHDGKCRNIHGHSYSLSVTIKGKPNALPGPQSGLVMDFAELKEIVNKAVIEPFDHALVLSDSDKRGELLVSTTKLIITAYQPSCENLLVDFVSRLEKHFLGEIRLQTIILRETATSYAMWSAGDQ
jgi:6-pyruvoyltetrahydropterin/6-carboxytetrahydropterin synthase